MVRRGAAQGRRERSRGVKLKKLRDASDSTAHPRWIWQLRWFDPATHRDASERIGYYCRRDRDHWRPSSRLAYMTQRDAEIARDAKLKEISTTAAGVFIPAGEPARRRWAEYVARTCRPAGLAFEELLELVSNARFGRFEDTCRAFAIPPSDTLLGIVADWADRKQSDAPASWDDLATWYKREGSPNAGHRSKLEASTAFKLFKTHCPELAERWQELSVDDARVFQNRLVAAKARPMTIRKHLTYMRALWNACKRTWVKGNPWSELAFPKHERDDEAWHYYTSTEVATLMGVAGTAWKARIRLAWKSSLRPGEIDHLRLSDVDWQEQRVRIRRHPANETTLEWHPKDKDARTAPLDPETILLLRQLQIKAGATPYLFVGERRWRQALALQAAGKWRPDMALVNGKKKAWDAIVNKAALTPLDDAPLVFYSLRKTCCCDMLTAGVPAHEVQALFGHANLRTTMTWYSKVNKADSEKRIRKAQERAG